MASKQAQALFILYSSFRKEGSTELAIRCLQAVCDSNKELPAVEAKTRLELARVLLDETENVSEARQHLERAVSPLSLGPGTNIGELELQVLCGTVF